MNFIQRVKHKISNKIIANRNNNILFGLIKKLFRRRYFEELCQRIDKFFLNTKKLEETFMKRIGMKFFELRVKQTKLQNLKLYKLNAKFKKKEKEINFGVLRKNVKISANYRQNNRLALINFEKIYFTQVIKGFKIYKKMKRNKRTLLLKAKRFNEKSYKKKILEKWKLYILYKKNKRNEYLYVQNKRNEILTKHFIKNLINISSENFKINDKNRNNNKINESNDYFNNNLILNNNINNENNLYFNKSNNDDYYMNKNNKDDDIMNQRSNTSINNNIGFNKNYNEKKENKKNDDLFDELKEIRNRQRSKPVILDLDSL